MSNTNHTVITQCVALGWPTQESLLRRPPSGVLCPVLLYGAFGFLGFHSLKQGLRPKRDQPGGQNAPADNLTLL